MAGADRESNSLPDNSRQRFLSPPVREIRSLRQLGHDRRCDRVLSLRRSVYLLDY